MPSVLAMPAAAAAIARLDSFAAAVAARSSVDAAPGAHADEDAAAQSLAAAAWERFGAAMDDDLAVPEALAALFDLVRDGNRALDAGCGVAGARALQETLVRIDATLALLPSATALPEIGRAHV